MHLLVAEAEGDPADDGGEDEARRGEHARDDHGEDLGAPCSSISISISTSVSIRLVLALALALV